MDVLGEIHEYSTAEFIAKADEYSQTSLSPYLEQAQLAISGASSGLSEETLARIGLHRLMLHDQEKLVLTIKPDLTPNFNSSDSYQLAMASSPYNLDYFISNGIPYEFDSAKLDFARSIVAMGNGDVTQSLIRERLLSLSGFGGVRVNYIFHDVLDHAWLFDFMREQGLHERYADFIEATGNPFEGHLMSRESELLSGIGFTSRRFLSDEGYYSNLAIDPRNLVAFLENKNAHGDPRVSETISVIDDGPTSTWAGFVVKATIGNLLLQREKWGGVKELSRLQDGSFVPTGNILSMTDPRYLSLIIETVFLLARNKRDYVNQQLALNDNVESILHSFLRTGRAAGSIAVQQDISDSQRLVRGNLGLSTNYFSQPRE